MAFSLQPSAPNHYIPLLLYKLMKFLVRVVPECSSAIDDGSLASEQVTQHKDLHSRSDSNGCNLDAWSVK